ncbi:MAG: hypothetical protein NTY11_02360 [Candidatus Parcubacteria bacterium]|nr:hypothetical protein [Candidatus Parcubacteria bacterium]
MEYEDQSIKTLLNQEEEELGDAGIEEDLPIEEDSEEETPAVEEEEGGVGEDLGDDDEI